jgi:large subunit ribosomal protein L7/L12
MSSTTNEIIEKLKSITLLEAAELVSLIEETFNVSASPQITGNLHAPISEKNDSALEKVEEKTLFDVILEDYVPEKKIPVIKVVRNLNSLGLKEAKEFVDSLPKLVKESISKEEAEIIKQKLEEAGGKIKIV